MNGNDLYRVAVALYGPRPVTAFARALGVTPRSIYTQMDRGDEPMPIMWQRAIRDLATNGEDVPEDWSRYLDTTAPQGAQTAVCGRCGHSEGLPPKECVKAVCAYLSALTATSA